MLRKCIKKIFNCFCILVIFSQTLLTIFATSSLPTFAIVDAYKKEESSISTVAPSFNFESVSQILMEPKTKKVLYENNADEKLLPASVTKVMTLLLTMEAIDNGNILYKDTVTCSSKASSLGGSQIWFKEGETLTVDEALKCICVASANDVSYAMAELVGGSETNFVSMMNDKAKKLGMLNTNFLNCHGLDEEGHYSSARDIAIMSAELITNHPDILKYTSIWMDSIRDGTFELANTNKLLKQYSGLTGLKTGSTSKALFNLSATATKGDMSLIAVVMKAPSSAIRNSEITELLNFGFSNYKVVNLATKNDLVTTIDINKSIGKKYDVVMQNDDAYVIPKGETLDYKRNIVIDEQIKAPMKKNDIVGKVEYIKGDDNVFYETNVVLSSDVIKSKYFDYLTYILKTFINANFSQKIA